MPQLRPILADAARIYRKHFMRIVKCIMLLITMITLSSLNTLQAQPPVQADVPPAAKVEVAQPKGPPQATPEKFEKEIAKFEAQDKLEPPVKNGIVFVGSSSIRLWPVKVSFPNRTILNRGFGGSITKDVNHFFDRIITPYEPQVIVYYAGDNDIGKGASAKAVVEDTELFADKVHKLWPQTVILYLPIKPSIKRWNSWNVIQETQRALQDYAHKNPHFIYVDVATPMLKSDGTPDETLYVKDGLHMTPKGYTIWTDLVEAQLQKYARP
jgi:lysophospholipase L1-like esterase